MKKAVLPFLVFVSGFISAQNFTEEFEDSTTVANAGWAIDNNSSPLGSTSWFQGNNSVFSAYSLNGYYAANYNNASSSGTISTWLMSPTRWFQNGDSILFYTRTTDSALIPTYPDRLQVRFSQNGTSTNAGVNPTDLGDFTMQLLEINPTYDTVGYPTGYPCHWRKYSIILSGLPVSGVSGRFAFRYFVENGGPSGVNSDYIGIDSCAYFSITNGIEDPNAFQFSIYPNPANPASTLQIQTEGDHLLLTISLLDLSGKLLQTESAFSLPQGNTFSLPDLASGFYMIQIRSPKGISTKRLIIN